MKRIISTYRMRYNIFQREICSNEYFQDDLMQQYYLPEQVRNYHLQTYTYIYIFCHIFMAQHSSLGDTLILALTSLLPYTKLSINNKICRYIQSLAKSKHVFSRNQLLVVSIKNVFQKFPLFFFKAVMLVVDNISRRTYS